MQNTVAEKDKAKHCADRKNHEQKSTVEDEEPEEPPGTVARANERDAQEHKTHKADDELHGTVGEELLKCPDQGRRITDAAQGQAASEVV